MYTDQVTPNSQAYPRSKSEGNEENDRGESQDAELDGENSDTHDMTPKNESDMSSSGGEPMDASPSAAEQEQTEHAEEDSVPVDT